MRSHVKASTAGSTQGQATGLGRILLGALATSGGVLRGKGSGAPAVAPRLAATALVVLAALLFAAAPAIAAPVVTTDAVTGNTGAKATLNGTVNPEGEELTECKFEWVKGFPPPFASTIPCAETSATIGSGTSPVAVHADLTNLEPNGTTYYFRLVAKTAASEPVNGPNQSFVTPNTVVTTAASGIGTTSATLNGTVNPDTIPLTECLFEYGPPKAHSYEVQKYDQTAPCVPNVAGVGSGTSPVAVHADLSGLPIGSVIRYRLKAANANGPIFGQDVGLQTAGPFLRGTWSEEVGLKEAVLKAEIDPEGAPTTYHFEWGTTAAYGSESPEQPVGSDSSAHEVTLFLGDLQPDTTYHYRVVVSSAVAGTQSEDHAFTTFAPFMPETACSNQAFRNGIAGILPDCRAYEMVSPIDKNGGNIEIETSFDNHRTALNKSAVGGNKFTYSAYRSFGDQASSRYSNQYLATRGSTGWTTRGINAPQGTTIFDPRFAPFEEFQNEFYAFSEDLSSGWLRDFNLAPITPDGIAGYANVYRRDNTTNTFEALTTDPPIGPADPSLGNSEGMVEVQGVSADENHVIFRAGAKLTPDAAAGTSTQLYDATNGELRLVSVLPDGSPNTTASHLGTHKAVLAGGSTLIQGMRNHAISDDGSRIFWSAGADRGMIFVRIDDSSTVQITSQPSRFWTATPDGDRMLYTPEGSFADLFEFDVDAQTHSLVATGVQGVLGASDDLSHIYFVSNRDLAPGGTAGERNLYLAHNGAIRFIAALSPQDLWEELSRTSVATGSPLNRSSRITPDGRRIAFTSHRSLTGYDNRDANNGQAAKEVFIYDADADRLTCVSCNPTGARPVSQPALTPFGLKNEVITGTGGVGRQWTAAWLTTAENAIYTPRALSVDGARLFFNSFDALVPQDTNGAQDVYQWEEQGSGSCSEPDGCVRLISTGQSPEKSEFVDATPNGSDVFFETESSISPQDPGLIDIYDARVGGGFPPPPALPTPCAGDACQNVPPPPNDPTPSSASFRGPGDRVTRGVRRRCTTRARRAAKRADRGSNRNLAKRCKRNKRRAGR